MEAQQLPALFSKLADADKIEIYRRDEDIELIFKEKEKIWDQDQHDQTLQTIR